MPYSFESSALYSGLSTRFEAAESHSLFRGMRGRGSCIFRCWLLSRDAFASSTRPCGLSKSRLSASSRLSTAPTHSGGDRHLSVRSTFWAELTSQCDHLAATSPAMHVILSRTSFVLRRSPFSVSSPSDGLTSSCSHLAMSSRRDDAETCSENCASPPRDLLKTCSPFGVHIFIVAVLGQHRRPCSPRGDHDHLCRRQLPQPRTPCDAHDHLHCRTALTTSNTLRCPRPCSPPCSSRDGLTFRCSPSRSLLRSPHNHQRLSTFTFVRAAGWPRCVFIFR